MPRPRTHTYDVTLEWTGDLGTGTSSYSGFSRDHTVAIEGVGVLPGSSDPAFRGDKSRYNPEQLLVSAVAQCHLLWYLHLCAQQGIVIIAYADRAHGVMVEELGGAGQFESVTLHPQVVVTDAARISEATELHARASEFCFIARSVNFPIYHEPTVTARQEHSSADQEPVGSEG